VLAAVGDHSMLSVVFVASALVWTLAWLPCGSSVPWAELLRFGFQAGALVTTMVGLVSAVAVCGVTTAFAAIVALISRWRRRRRFEDSELPQAMEELLQIQNRLRLWGDSSTSEVSDLDMSEQGAATELLGLESQLPFERLKLSFLQGRREEWQAELINATDYATVLQKLEELKEAIHEPCTRVLLKQVLRGVRVPGRTSPFPGPLTDMLAAFTYPKELSAKVEPPYGWESGELDLEGLRRQAKIVAASLLKEFRTRGAVRESPTVFGRPSQLHMRSMIPAMSTSSLPPVAERRKRPRQNANLVGQYRWLEPVTRAILGDGSGLFDVINPACTPLFAVAGTCPSSWPPSPMQAVLFVQLSDGGIDFWWVKPESRNASVVERATLSKHASGRFKNVAESSKKVFEPLARKFRGSTDGDCTFGVDCNGRAFITEGPSTGPRRRMLVYFIWLESWGSGDGGRKFLEGKVCYEKVTCQDPTADIATAQGPQLAARQFRIEGDRITLVPQQDEEALPDVMPGGRFQEMY